MSVDQNLLNSNIQALNEGAELLGQLESEQYTSACKPAFQSTIGAHFRHVLEHYRCLIGQLGCGVICYDSRERDSWLECDIEYAKRTITELKTALIEIDVEAFTRNYSIVDQQSTETVSTTLDRELLFLQSHTTHHYAMAAAMARLLGYQPADNFGVAIATINHYKKHDEDNNSIQQTIIKEIT